jgi:hypothetical protein
VRDDETWYLMHLPMQAGFALAVPVAAAVAVLALANGVAGWWFAVVLSAYSLRCRSAYDLTCRSVSAS